MNKQLSRQIMSTLLLLSTLLFAHAQIIITPQIPPTGLIKKDQLWNIVLVSNADASHDIQLQVSMQDIKTGEKVLTGSSRLLTIAKGARQLQLNDVGPVQYNYSNSAMIVDRTSNGLLPIGSYQVCYTLIEQTDKNSLPSQEECIPVEIEPLSPAQLNAPFNSDTVATKYPLFQWIPPAPLSMFSDLNYGFVLVEVNKGQNANDAVQKNTPIYFQNNIRNMFLPYPTSGKALEEGKTYAWQVTVNNGNSYAAKTESWAFTVISATQLPGIKASGFPRLQPGAGALYYVFDDQLKFAYSNTTNDTLVSMQVFSEKPPSAPAIYKKDIQVVSGENLIQQDILGKRVFREGELYRLEIIETSGSKWMILFMYNKPLQ